MPPRARLGDLERRTTRLEQAQKASQQVLEKERLSFKDFTIKWIGPKTEGKRLNYPHLDILYDTLPYKRQFMVLLPREHLKSTVAGIAYPVWHLFYDPGKTIIVASATSSVARKNLHAIKAFLTYLGLKPQTPDKWTQNEIYLSRAYFGKDPSVMAVGVDTTSVGSHADIVIYDDIHDKDNISEIGRKAVKRFYGETMQGVLKPGGQELVIGTRWHFDDIYEQFIQTWPKENYVRKGVWADKEKGIPLFPEVFTPEVIAEKKARMDTDAFARQFLNDILQAENRPFKLEYLVHYNMETMKWHNIDEAWQTVQAVDMISSEKERRDWFVSIILSRNNEGKFYIRELVREQVSVQKEIAEIERLFKAYNPFKVAIGAGGSQMLISLLKGATNWPIMPIPERTHKSERIGSLSGFFEQRRIHLPMNAPWYKTFETEYLEYPDSKHDDQLDALSMAMQAFGTQQSGFVIFNPQAVELRPGHMREFEGLGFSSASL